MKYRKRLLDQEVILLLKSNNISIHSIIRIGVSFRRVKKIMLENNIILTGKKPARGKNKNGTNTKHTKLS